ncbi:isochorismatase family protein [Ruminococcaceae bacterium OttesenSCG-928-A16]|nr:isochorismatase family protein [Ruminococcaceae bacterium OttesenSCG-928-A16]
MKKLLVVVDYQNDFVTGALGFAGAETLEPDIAAAVTETLQNDGYVLFTRDTHPKGYLHTREGGYLPIPHCIEGTPGHQLFGSLHLYEETPTPHTAILNKPTFGSPDIGQAAIALCQTPPDVVELCGLVTDICVVANAILLHSFLPNASIKVRQALCGSGNTQNAGAAFALLKGMGIVVE